MPKEVHHFFGELTFRPINKKTYYISTWLKHKFHMTFYSPKVYKYVINVYDDKFV
jgi:hypothetical protein